MMLPTLHLRIGTRAESIELGATVFVAPRSIRTLHNLQRTRREIVSTENIELFYGNTLIYTCLKPCSIFTYNNGISIVSGGDLSLIHI